VGPNNLGVTLSKVGYTIETGGAVSLSASVAKSVLGVSASSSSGVDLRKLRVGFEAGPFNVPVLVQLCYATFSVNPPGTNSTSVGINQVYGRTIAATGLSAGANWTVEPQVLTTIDVWQVPPNGLVVYDFPAGESPDCAPSNGFVLRLIANNAATVRCSLWFERC
jgi:hypothetical protein